MASLDWHLTRIEGVTLVQLLVTSGTDERVRIDSHLEPVWPPRREGEPASGWDGASFEGTVTADRRLVLGYASPAEPREPPAEIAVTGPVPEDENEDVTARDIVRTLGDASPPRDAVRVSDGAGTAPSTGNAKPPGQNRDGTGPRASSRNGGAVSAVGENRTGDAPAEWLDEVEGRLARAERLTAATDADEAREIVDSLGGLDAVRGLQAQLDADREQLDALERHTSSLADRLGEVEVPLATLERIA